MQVEIPQSAAVLLGKASLPANNSRETMLQRRVAVASLGSAAVFKAAPQIAADSRIVLEVGGEFSVVASATHRIRLA